MGDVYGPFIKDLLDYERGQITVLEQRAAAVITTSGVLVSLSFAIAAVVTESETFQVPSGVRVLLIVALALFLVAAALAISVNLPRSYAAADAESLREIIDDFDVRERMEGPYDLARLHLDLLEDVRRKATLKGWMIAIAMVLEVAAVLAVGAAVVAVLASG